jgi:hypothetical protein
MTILAARAGTRPVLPLAMGAFRVGMRGHRRFGLRLGLADGVERARLFVRVVLGLVGLGMAFMGGGLGVRHRGAFSCR